MSKYRQIYLYIEKYNFSCVRLVKQLLSGLESGHFVLQHQVVARVDCGRDTLCYYTK